MHMNSTINYNVKGRLIMVKIFKRGKSLHPTLQRFLLLINHSSISFQETLCACTPLFVYGKDTVLTPNIPSLLPHFNPFLWLGRAALLVLANSCGTSMLLSQSTEEPACTLPWGPRKLCSRWQSHKMKAAWVLTGCPQSLLDPQILCEWHISPCYIKLLRPGGCLWLKPNSSYPNSAVFPC